MRTYECVYTLFYLVVVPCSWLLVSGPQSLKLGVQYVKQLLDQSHGRADISGLDPTPRVVHQLSCDVGSVFTALYLHTNTNTYMFTCIDGNSVIGWMLKLVGKLFTRKPKRDFLNFPPKKPQFACYLLSNQKRRTFNSPSPISVNTDSPCRRHHELFTLPSAVSLANHTLSKHFAIEIDFCQKEKV